MLSPVSMAVELATARRIAAKLGAWRGVIKVGFLITMVRHDVESRDIFYHVVFMIAWLIFKFQGKTVLLMPLRHCCDGLQ